MIDTNIVVILMVAYVLFVFIAAELTLGMLECASGHDMFQKVAIALGPVTVTVWLVTLIVLIFVDLVRLLTAASRRLFVVTHEHVRAE